ncbi:hypothetical protein [Clostridium tetani]|uniref:hypothetical protein n=1 Tax=Clostridium tetani TaxID=1513 RepID=UPI0013E94031|nr:hypothetical protein [Clostridium tetani]
MKTKIKFIGIPIKAFNLLIYEANPIYIKENIIAKIASLYLKLIFIDLNISIAVITATPTKVFSDPKTYKIVVQIQLCQLA